VNLALSVYIREKEGDKITFLSLSEGFLISAVMYRGSLWIEDIRILEVNCVMSIKNNISGM
jgi:hypothetical protein